jgi:AbrB family looped-hinge helix DNA binding protein
MMDMAIPKIVQVDKRGQIVIPKEVRDELDIDAKTTFSVYSVTDEAILLKKE